MDTLIETVRLRNGAGDGVLRRREPQRVRDEGALLGEEALGDLANGLERKARDVRDVER